MNIESVVFGGFVATLLLTTLMAAAQGLGWSRMSIPFMLGTALTPFRRRAMVIGFALHFASGWGFAFFYAWAFEYFDHASGWAGAAFGAVQSLAVLVALMPVLPYLHPRMASEDRGPDPTRSLEPPGFLALNYGHQTPLVTIAAHIIYGGVLGAVYRLAG